MHYNACTTVSSRVVIILWNSAPPILKFISSDSSFMMTSWGLSGRRGFQLSQMPREDCLGSQKFQTHTKASSLVCFLCGEEGREEAEQRFRQAEVVTSYESIKQNLTKSGYGWPGAGVQVRNGHQDPLVRKRPQRLMGCDMAIPLSGRGQGG